MKSIKLFVLTFVLAFAGVAYAASDDSKTATSCCAKSAATKEAHDCCAGDACEKAAVTSDAKAGKKESCCPGACCEQGCCKGKDGEGCSMKAKHDHSAHPASAVSSDAKNCCSGGSCCSSGGCCQKKH